MSNGSPVNVSLSGNLNQFWEQIKESWKNHRLVKELRKAEEDINLLYYIVFLVKAADSLEESYNIITTGVSGLGRNYSDEALGRIGEMVDGFTVTNIRLNWIRQSIVRLKEKQSRHK